MTRLRAAAPLVGLALLALVLAWTAADRTIPGLIGLTRDDGEYVAYARALLAGLGYVDPATPTPVPANRYPIGFPLLLAAVMAGAKSWPDQLARLAWVGPVALALYAGLAYAAMRRLGGLPPVIALAGAACCAGGNQVIMLGETLMSDLPFAVLSLLSLLAADRLWREAPGRAAPAAWAATGALLAATCLVRYAGVALLLAFALAMVAGRRGREALAAAFGFAAIFGPWVIYRSRLGGESYGSNFADFLPSGADWGPRLVEAWTAVATGGPSTFFLPQTVAFAPPPAPVLGLGITLVAAWGTWCWLRGPSAGMPRLPAVALVCVFGLTAVWTVAFVRLEPALPTRLLLSVAPLLWIAVARGGADLLARARLPADQARGLATLGALVCVLATSLDARFAPRLTASDRAAIARDHLNWLAAINATVPLDARVASKWHFMVWLYTGRHGHTIPPDIAAGNVRALKPYPFLLVLEHWRLGYVAASPSLWGGQDENRDTLNPFLQAYPGVLRPLWQGAGGAFAVLRVEPAAFAKVCKAFKVRETNAAFEAREGERQEGDR